MLTLTALLFALVFQAPKPPEVQGAVVRADSGSSLAGAQVTLIRSESAPDPLGRDMVTVLTDSKGHFSFPSVASGTYRVFAVREGFVRTEFGQRTTTGRGITVVVAPNRQPGDITIRLLPTATVTGRVTGAGGEPLTGFVVELLHATYDSHGNKALRPLMTTRTDDRGEYRLFWITPGRYYVGVNPRTQVDEEQSALSRQMLQELASPAGVSPDGLTNAGILNLNQTFFHGGYSHTYYPSNTDWVGAVMLDLKPAEELGGINIQAVQQPSFRVRGRVVTATGQPAREGELTLRSPDGLGTHSGIKGDSTFEMRNVISGAYTLTARTANGQASANLTVAADMDNVVVTVQPGVNVSGRIDVEGKVPASDVGLGRLQVEFPGARTTRARADGTFMLQNVFPGDYWIRIPNLPPNVYVKEMRAQGTDLLRAPLTVTSGTAPILEIVMGKNTGKVAGTVTDARQSPVGASEVVLIPDYPRERHELYRKIQTDADGHFLIENVAPGNYKVFAWEELEPYSYFDPAVLRQYEQVGTAVQVGEGTAITATVTIVAATGR